MATSHCFSTSVCDVSWFSSDAFEHKQKTQNSQVQTGAPAYLTRALYLPKHTHHTSHLPIYDISKRYFEALGPFPLGARKYKIEFCLLAKPCGYHPDDDVRFLVDMDSGGFPTTIRERCMGRDALDVTTQVLRINQERYSADSFRSSCHKGNGVSLHIQSPKAQTCVGARLTYTTPVGPTKRGFTYYPNLEPGLKVSDPDSTLSHSLKWQLHMDTPGSLRYDLIDLDHKSPDDENDSIVAIYHHCGFEKGLHATFSEGVVLLPGAQDPILNIVIVSSLLCLLHSVRKQDIRVKKSQAKYILGKFVP